MYSVHNLLACSMLPETPVETRRTVPKAIRMDNPPESDVDKNFAWKLKEREQSEEESQEGVGTCKVEECDRRKADCPLTYKQAIARNEQLLKDLAVSRARLRTYTAYSPTEQQLRTLARAYWRQFREKIEKPLC